MATALSIDQWQPPESSKCLYDIYPDLSVNFLCMHPPKATSLQGDNNNPPNKADAARYQEIFVDLVGMHSASLDAASRHVLDERFDSFLRKGERELKDSLLNFLENQTEEAKGTQAFQYLEDTLQRTMGYQSGLLQLRRKQAHQRPDTKTTINQDEKSSISTPISDNLRDFSTMGAANKNSGHVFVCNASVCELQCDAFLCPAQISKKKGRLSGRIVSRWRKTVLCQTKDLSDCIPTEGQWHFKTYADRHRVVTLRDWPWEALRKNGRTPCPFLIAGEVSLEGTWEYAGMARGTTSVEKCALPPQDLHIEALMETVRQSLTVAIQELEQNQPKPGTFRERYLVALPVLGTGGGFAGDLTGQIVVRLMQLLSSFVAQRGNLDVVLVCADDAVYAHAQTLRLEAFERLGNQNQLFSIPCFNQLGDGLRAYAIQLARLASKRQLSLFMGAGVSIGSGLPSWFGLLEKVEDAFTSSGQPQERKLGNECAWDPLEMAATLDKVCQSTPDRHGAIVPLKQRICTFIKTNSHRPGLLLSLLASLPCDSMVTQNYDQLIEKAYDYRNVVKNYHGERSLGPEALSVIPYYPNRQAHQWLLKMHGCVTAPDEIVITREDYEKYESSRARALIGLVQASLMTKHLVFIGFSLSDPNYLRIVDEVRMALHPYSDPL